MCICKRDIWSTDIQYVQDCCGRPQGLAEFRALHVGGSFIHKLTVDSSTDPPLLYLLRLSKLIKYVFPQPPEEAFICNSSVLTISFVMSTRNPISYSHIGIFVTALFIFFIMCSKLHSKRLTPILQLMVGMWFVCTLYALNMLSF